jgi:hypothetical protein
MQDVTSHHGRLITTNEDPEDYPRAGYIFNSLAARGLTYRDYGDFVRLSGYDEGESEDAKVDDPEFDGADDLFAPTRGLGGRYSLNVSAPRVLADHIDLDYPGWNARIRDIRRAHEFIRDYDALARAAAIPRYTHIWLPANSAADSDRALGIIVEYLTHLPTWRTTAIFILPAAARTMRDHVSARRSYVIVVSPYARRKYLDMRHFSTASVLKTEEELLGLPALSIGDLLTSDLTPMFAPHADETPFRALPAKR